MQHAITLAKLPFSLSSAPQVKPCQAGFLEYRREGPYFVLSFLLCLFCVLCGVTKKYLSEPVHDHDKR